MPQIILSPSAERDLDEIDLGTIELFGFVQADRIMNQLQSAMQDLAEQPGLGHAREDLDPPGRSFRYFSVQKRFVIVYQSSSAGIQVARIVDGARDFGRLNLGDI